MTEGLWRKAWILGWLFDFKKAWHKVPCTVSTQEAAVLIMIRDFQMKGLKLEMFKGLSRTGHIVLPRD